MPTLCFKNASAGTLSRVQLKRLITREGGAAERQHRHWLQVGAALAALHCIPPPAGFRQYTARLPKPQISTRAWMFCMSRLC